VEWSNRQREKLQSTLDERKEEALKNCGRGQQEVLLSMHDQLRSVKILMINKHHHSSPSRPSIPPARNYEGATRRELVAYTPQMAPADDIPDIPEHLPPNFETLLKDHLKLNLEAFVKIAKKEWKHMAMRWSRRTWFCNLIQVKSDSVWGGDRLGRRPAPVASRRCATTG
jgi:hypothetical protein